MKQCLWLSLQGTGGGGWGENEAVPVVESPGYWGGGRMKQCLWLSLQGTGGWGGEE